MIATEPIWKNYFGKETPVSKLDDQHLSNIYWYNLVLFDDVPECILDEIKSRNGGKLDVLLWKPLPIPSEIKNLRDKGMIIGNAIVMQQGNKAVVIGTITHISPMDMLKTL